MRHRFHKPNRSQLHLLPILIDQWVEHFNLGQFYAAYGDEGAPPYDPQMMLATSYADQSQARMTGVEFLAALLQEQSLHLCTCRVSFRDR